MASFCKCAARLGFFALIIIQCFFLVGYPVTYKNDPHWFILATSFVPAVIVWLCLVASNAKLRSLFFVWYLYIICALIPNIAIVFVVVGDSLDKNRFLGPNALKLVLCITPLLLLLLLHTADNSDQNDEHIELVSKLSFRMVIDLFDAVEMIDIVLQENQHDVGIPNWFGAFMIVLACFSLALSTWQLAENKLSGGETNGETKGFCRNIVEIFFVNLPFLIIRAVVFFEYGKDESIFMAKNGIAIILSVLEIRHIRVSP